MLLVWIWARVSLLLCFFLSLCIALMTSAKAFQIIFLDLDSKLESRVVKATLFTRFQGFHGDLEFKSMLSSCSIFGRGVLDWPLFLGPSVYLTSSQMDQMIQFCDQLVTSNMTTLLVYEALSERVIVPGTRWCGQGNIASDENDLGLFRETDHCCRNHDFCGEGDKGISPGETKFGLTNEGTYARLACECDHQFYSCLKNNHDAFSDAIGSTFFDCLGTVCFAEDYPQKCCSIRRPRSSLCLKYTLYRNETKLYQYWDPKQYFESPKDETLSSLCHPSKPGKPKQLFKFDVSPSAELVNCAVR